MKLFFVAAAKGAKDGNILELVFSSLKTDCVRVVITSQ